MQTVLEEFEERVSELETFLKMVQRLEDPQVSLYRRSNRNKLARLKSPDLTVLKATVFLMIYNIVESSIRSAFAEVYKEVAGSGLGAAQLSAAIRKIWIRQEFHKLDLDSAAARNFREIAERVAEEVVSASPLQLASEFLPVSGNLDATAVRSVCQLHGVSVKVHRRALGGSELKTVREQRNALAHGDKSFSACGREYAIDDLLRIKQQAVIYVRGILKNVGKYVSKKSYATS